MPGDLTHFESADSSLLLFSRSVASDSLQPHGLQHVRLPCPLLSLGVCLGWEDHLEKAMAIKSSILTWRIPWTEEPGGPTVHGVAKSRTWLSYQHLTTLDNRFPHLGLSFCLSKVRLLLSKKVFFKEAECNSITTGTRNAPSLICYIKIFMVF